MNVRQIISSSTSYGSSTLLNAVSFSLGLVRFLFGLRLSSFHFHRIRFFVSLHLHPYITCKQEFGLYYCIQRDLHQIAAKLGVLNAI
ncbi:hypothetical protein L1887_29579 [Cichorium endivia]|nr:hypothetical protein L1887_29579 [Cichorium endivia]